MKKRDVDGSLDLVEDVRMTKMFFSFLCFVSLSCFANDQCANIIDAQYCDVLGDEDSDIYCGGYVFKTVFYHDLYYKNDLKEYYGVQVRFSEDGFLYEAEYNDLAGTARDIILVDQYCTILQKTNVRYDSF